MELDQKELFNKSLQLVPGGVHSPVRSFKGLPMTPRFIESADGAYITDTDGKDYIDFCMSFGPMILGHKDKDVEDSLINALKNGWSFGACEPYSLKLANFLVENLEGIDQVRFVNSGTEAVMTALRLARGVTNKSKIIKFNGCYHGHVDSMLIKAGSGLAGTAEASSAGIPEGISKDTLILELGDLEGVLECFKNHAEDIAAVIIEPLPANNGLLTQDLNFLKALREITKDYNSLLIFDEVISGFRVSMGGMAEKTGINPDIRTYGKIIGGGLPVGAIASTKTIMENLAPIGNVYQAGTLSANPLAMVGGLSTLKKLTKETYEKIEGHTNSIAKIFTKWFNKYENGKFKNYQIHHEASLFWIVESDQLHRASDIPANILEGFNELFSTLLEKGIYLSPNAYEVGFVSLAHNEETINDLEKRLWS